jgi:hypothetical protein
MHAGRRHHDRHEQFPAKFSTSECRRPSESALPMAAKVNVMANHEK